MIYTIQPNWPRKTAPIGEAEFDQAPPVGLVLVINGTSWTVEHVEAHLAGIPMTVESMTIVVSRGRPGEIRTC